MTDSYYPAEINTSDTQYEALLDDDDECPIKDVSSAAKKESLKSFDPLKTKFLLFGSLIGFSIQLISLGGYIYTMLRFGRNVGNLNLPEAIIYVIVSFFSSIDLCVYSVLWLAFTLSMTKTGVLFVMKQLDTDIGCTRESRRFVFILGLRGLVGLVLGAFFAWTLIDTFLGFPVPYTPILYTVLIDLLLCYSMRVCYDCGKDTLEDDDSDDEDEDDDC